MGFWDRAPNVSLEWEEHLFRGLLAVWHRVRPSPGAEIRPEAARLEPEAGSLAVLARALSGEMLRVVPSHGQGGVRAGDLLIPDTLDLGGSAEENREAMVLRVAVGATIRRLGLDQAFPDEARARALASLNAGRRATEILVEELATFADLHRRVAARELSSRPTAPAAWELLRAGALDLDQSWSPSAPPAGDPGPGLRMWGELIRPIRGPSDATVSSEETASSSGSERKGRVADEVERVLVDEERAKEKVITHVFEKVETLDEHQGQVQKMDGADELDDHQAALDELDLKTVIRGGERARSLYRAETGIDADVPDVADVIRGERGIAYDEWDQRVGRYKKGWCTVYPTAMGRGDGRWAAERLPEHRALIEDLHRRLVIHRSQRAIARAQPDGDDLDLDAIVNEHADRRSGRGPSGRVYLRKPRRLRSFATTVLLDISLSTDAWVQNRRVLDVAREAVLVLGEVADRLGDPLQVLAFASQTRNRCRVWTVRDWGEPWALGKARLGTLHPQGYTRIGAALRHAFTELGHADAERPLLLLVSDGKPTDHDRYEGRYGVADVRQALREAEQRGILTHALAVDAIARDHLPPMLGPGAWHILPDPRRLPEALTAIYGRLTT